MLTFCFMHAGRQGEIGGVSKYHVKVRGGGVSNCTELLGYTQLTQCIDKSRFISSLAFSLLH